MQSRGSELPSGYIKIKYLESNEKQYITTNTTVDVGDYIFVSASSLSVKNFNTIVGIDYSSSAEIFFENHVPKVWNGGIIIEIKYIDGITGYGNVRNIAFMITGNIAGIRRCYQLFSYNKEYKLCGRIYNFNVKGRTNLVPCLDPSGKPCMYDTVTQQPFYNQGTGEFGYELMDGTYVAPI